MGRANITLNLPYLITLMPNAVHASEWVLAGHEFEPASGVAMGPFGKDQAWEIMRDILVRYGRDVVAYHAVSDEKCTYIEFLFGTKEQESSVNKRLNKMLERTPEYPGSRAYAFSNRYGIKGATVIHFPI